METEETDTITHSNIDANITYMRRYTSAGHLIRTARTGAGMTQDELSSETGVSASRISEYENGRRDPSVDMLLKLLAGTGHTIALVDAADSNFAERHTNRRTMCELFEYTDLWEANRSIGKKR